MYPINFQKSNYKTSIIDIFSDIIDFIMTSVKSFKSFETLVVFLEKKFYF